MYGGAGLFNAAIMAPPSLPGLMDTDMDVDFGMGLSMLEMSPSYHPGTSAASANWGGGVPLLPPSSSSGGHALRSGKKKQESAASPTTPKTMDLLEEFDTRMKKVREWTFLGTEAIHLE